MGRQLIETAPKDGTEILGWRSDCGILLIKYTNAESLLTPQELEESELSESDLYDMDWFCADFTFGQRLEGDEVPTHWMPLPCDPSEVAS